MPLASAIWAKADPYLWSLSRMRCLGRWSKGYDFLPRSVHADETADPTIGAHGVPIYQNTTYGFTSYDELAAYRQGKCPHFVYTRDGNPTVRSLEVKLAALEGAEEAVACASGMAGISATLLHLLGGGGQHRREGGTTSPAGPKGRETHAAGHLLAPWSAGIYHAARWRGPGGR